MLTRLVASLALLSLIIVVMWAIALLTGLVASLALLFLVVVTWTVALLTGLVASLLAVEPWTVALLSLLRATLQSCSKAFWTELRAVAMKVILSVRRVASLHVYARPDGSAVSEISLLMIASGL